MKRKDKLESIYNAMLKREKAKRKQKELEFKLSNFIPEHVSQI